MALNRILEELEKKIEYAFRDKSLLRLAFTHKSYAHEKKRVEKDQYNERIEFLGDAILELIISEQLYAVTPLLSEGDMTKKRAQIVCEQSLSEAFKSIDAENYLLLGRCEIATDGKRKNAIIADAFEALLGAIYLDSGYETAKKVALKILNTQIDNTLKGNNISADYKTKLQELLQKKGNMNIEYIVLDENGPDHEKIFSCAVKIDTIICGKGEGKSRKLAEQNAAKEAYETRTNETNN